MNVLQIKRYAVVALGLLICTSANAYIEGIDYASLEVDGETINFPVGNDERKNDVYYLKKAMAGDKTAREVFLGGDKVKWFFIGETEAKWLKVTEDGEEIITP